MQFAVKSTIWDAHEPPFLPDRREELEWLDLGEGSDQEVRENLAEMDRINRWLGGDRALFLHLLPRLKASPGRTVLVDLGTGSGNLPNRLAGWAARSRLDLQAWGVDWSARNLRAAADPARGALVQADAAALPFRAGAVDYCISSLFMHHFSPEALVQLLRSAYRVAQRGLVMSDLVRGWLPLFFFRLAAPALARNRLTRHDGALSILRAYRPEELLRLARQAGLPDPHVYTHWPWRMTLVVDR